MFESMFDKVVLLEFFRSLNQVLIGCQIPNSGWSAEILDIFLSRDVGKPF